MKEITRDHLETRQGFVVMELLLVIAVVSVLTGAGAAVYTGYVRSAEAKLDEKLRNEVIYACRLGRALDGDVRGRIKISAGGDVKVEADDPRHEELVKRWLENAFGPGWAQSVRYRTETFSETGDVNLPDDLREPEEAPAGAKLEALTFDGVNLCGGRAAAAEFLGEETLRAVAGQYGLTDASGDAAWANAVLCYAAGELRNLSPEAVAKALQSRMVAEQAVDKAEALGISRGTAYLLDYAALGGYANSRYASEAFRAEFQKGAATREELAHLHELMHLDGQGSGQPTSYMWGAGHEDMTKDLTNYFVALAQLRDGIESR